MDELMRVQDTIFVYHNHTIDSLGIIIASSKEVAITKMDKYFRVPGAEPMEYELWSWEEWKTSEHYDFPLFDDLLNIIK